MNNNKKKKVTVHFGTYKHFLFYSISQLYGQRYAMATPTAYNSSPRTRQPPHCQLHFTQF